jgi:class 3 adenylate cyclase
MALTVYLVVRRATRSASAIAAPLREVTEATDRLGTSLATRPLHHVGITEIDDLTTQFARMTRELVKREEALVDAAVTRSVQQRSHELLCKALPPSIVDRMMGGTRVIADSFDCVTVLFADVVGFTPMAAQRSAADVVDFLDRIFLAFDEIIERHGLEKIKTIGDAYMAVSGAPTPVADHAERAARAALELHQALEAMDLDTPMKVRIGIHSGPAVAGVIGKNKVLYDLWGSTVNMASRLESHGAAGQTHLSEATAQLLPDSFEIQARGPVTLKGIGDVRSCWLLKELRDTANVRVEEKAS